MAGGYENEDRMAELEELRREKEREARGRLERARRELMAPDPATARDPASGHALGGSDPKARTHAQGKESGWSAKPLERQEEE